MKRVTQLVVALVLSVGIFNCVSTSSVNAVDVGNCDNIVIFNTGPGSDNSIRCVDDLDLEVTCNGTIYVLTENSQTALSGAATVTGNTSGAGAASGTAVNSNDTAIHYVGEGCGTTTTTTTPETPATPSVPATPVATPKVAVLPFTASSSVAETALISLVAVAVVIATSRIAVLAYRRATQK
jgi:hypothetical protein